MQTDGGRKRPKATRRCRLEHTQDPIQKPAADPASPPSEETRPARVSPPGKSFFSSFLLHFGAASVFQLGKKEKLGDQSNQCYSPFNLNQFNDPLTCKVATIDKTSPVQRANLLHLHSPAWHRPNWDYWVRRCSMWFVLI